MRVAAAEEEEGGGGGGGGGGGDDEEDPDEIDPEALPNPVITFLRVALTSTEIMFDNLVKRILKLWVTRDPTLTGRLFFFTAGMILFGTLANVLGPTNPLEFGRDSLLTTIMGKAPEWVFDREQGPVQATLVTMTSACVAAIAKIRLGNNMVPLSPFMHGVLGLPVGFMLVFRWNNAYERWWSGRTELGMLLMHSKNLGGSFCTWVAGSDQQLATRALALICALKECVADRLNGTILADGRVMLNETTLTTPLHPDDLEGLFAAENKVLYCIESLRNCIFKAHKQGLLPPPILGGMQNEDLFHIMEAYGECEKVVNQPPPGCIITHLKSTLMVYMCALPFILVHEVGVLAVVPTTAILSLALFGTEAAAEQIEQPFGNRPYHLPVRALIMSNTRDMGQTSRPVLGFSGYVNSPRAQTSSFEIPTIAPGEDEEGEKGVDVGSGGPLLYGSADAWTESDAADGDGEGADAGGGNLTGPSSGNNQQGQRTGTITVVQPAVPMEGESIALPSSRDSDDGTAVALGMEAPEGERLGGEAGSTDLSAPTNLGQVFFAQTQSKLNELRGANGVFSSDHGRTNGKASGGGASNGHSNGHHSKADSLNPSAQPWVPNSSSPYSYNAATGPDSPRKSMPTWKTQTPIEVFGNNDIDGQGSTRSTSHRYHVGDKSRRNVKEAGPGSSVSAPGSPVRRGFDFGQFVPSPLGMAPVVDGGPRPGSPSFGLTRTSSLDRETNGAGVGGKSSASGFDFSSGPAAQSASTGTADTLFGTEAAGASRSVFSSGANANRLRRRFHERGIDERELKREHLPDGERRCARQEP